MSEKYHIDTSLDVPIYRQLTDVLSAQIKSGEKACGEKLPTVQELAKTLSLAKGTVKRCYDELEKNGLIEKRQGSGTFVKYKGAGKSSRKEEALSAIDQMLEKLEELNISDSEAAIFIDLKLKEKRLPDTRINIVVIASCREILYSLSQSVRSMEDTDVYSYTLEDILKYPYKVGEEADIIVTHGEIYDRVLSILPQSKKVFCAELTLAPGCLAEIAALKKPTALICQSAEFFRTVRRSCDEYGFSVKPIRLDYSDLNEFNSFSRFIVPEGFERFCSKDEADRINEKRPLKAAFVPDKGSARALRERAARALALKRE